MPAIEVQLKYEYKVFYHFACDATSDDATLSEMLNDEWELVKPLGVVPDERRGVVATLLLRKIVGVKGEANASN